MPRLALGCALLLASAATPSAPPLVPVAARVPVLVELFTSEGCSSCPPADRELAELVARQPVPGAEVVPVSLHVDYWNRLGWTDPFSSAQATERQSAYASFFSGSRFFGTPRVYTPQMVVDGAAELVGSDSAKARSAIAEAARLPKGQVVLTRDRLSPGGVPIGVRVTLPRGAGAGDVLLVVTEDALSTDVRRGENAGRRLAHTGVARAIVKLGVVGSDGSFEHRAVVAVEEGWRLEALSAVVFVQETRGRRVLAVGRLALG